MAQHASAQTTPGGHTGDAGIKRRWALGAGGGAHALHDGFTDTLYVLLPIWAESFGLSYVQVGLLKTLYSGAMAALQIPAGLLAERWGERRLLALGTIVLGIGFAGFGWAGGLVGLVLCLVLAGAGSSVQHPLASSIIARAFSGGPHRAALGTYNFLGDLGKVVFPAAMAFGIALLGWQRGSLAFGLVAIAAGVGVYLALRQLDLGNRPESGNGAGAENEKAGAGWGIRHRGGFACLAAIGAVDTATRSAFLVFLPFLIVARGGTVETVGFALALTFAGGALGKLACGLAAERIGVIRSVVVTEFLTGTLILAIVAIPLGWVLALLPVLGISLNGTSSVLYGTVGDFADPDRRPRVFGLFYTLGIGASAAAPPLYGLVSDAAGLETALSIVGFSVFATLPLCFLLRPTILHLMQPRTIE